MARRILVEQRVPEQHPALRDRRPMRNQRHLAQPPGAFIRADQPVQHILASCSLRLNDLPVLKAHGDILDQRPLV